MAHFIATIDLSHARRRQFLQEAQKLPMPPHGISKQIFEYDNFALISWSQPGEPFRHNLSAEGRAFVWGHAMERQQPVATSPDLLALWRTLPVRMPAPLEGLHVAFVYRPDGSWTAGADILGLVPVYYWKGADCVLVGSSPELFRAHPQFQPELDAKGMVGIFLTNGLVDGHTLLKGVRRLASGKLLHAQPEAAPQELTQYFPEANDRYFGSTYEDNYRRVEETLQDCFQRHVNTGQSYGLILSGGLDSRTVAGAMQQLGARFAAFTFGSASDIEMQCATAAAKVLRVDHQAIPVRMECYAAYANQECRWNHLANGLSTLMFQEPMPAAARCPGGMLSGFALDHVVGASIIDWAGGDPDRMSFETYSRKVHRWSIPVSMVKRLVAHSFGVEVVDNVLSRLEQIYNRCAEREYQKAWLFTNYHRVRFHTSAVLGLHLQWPWPVVPCLDTRMLDLMAGMPYEHIHGRRMQYHMIKARYPALARVPLDRNSFNMKPLVSTYGRVINHLLFKPREVFYKWTQGIHDRRFYYRAMDFNSPGWHAVRLAAEPHRSRAAQVLNADVLAEILPPPGAKVAVADGIIDSSKMKLITGFLLWSANNL